MKVTEKTKIVEILKNEKAQKILAKHGLYFCYMCPMATMETLEDAMKTHGIKKHIMKKIIKEINE